MAEAQGVPYLLEGLDEEVNEQELIQLRDELRELVREAHGATKDLVREIKTARELVPLLTDELFTAEVKKQVSALGEATTQAMDAATDRVAKRFEALEALFLGEDKQSRRKGEPSIPALIQKRQNER